MDLDGVLPMLLSGAGTLNWAGGAVGSPRDVWVIVWVSVITGLSKVLGAG